ncbi:MAG TPA: KH domain-containing protein [Acidobacteriaceae bacterium]
MADVMGNNPASNSATDMKMLMTEIARALCDEPDAVQVEAIQEGDATLLRLRVAPNDIGKVIGKQGRTARSLRTILGAASMKLQHRYGLDIVESDHDGGRGE